MAHSANKCKVKADICKKKKKILHIFSLFNLAYASVKEVECVQFSCLS